MHCTRRSSSVLKCISHHRLRQTAPTSRNDLFSLPVGIFRNLKVLGVPHSQDCIWSKLGSRRRWNPRTAPLAGSLPMLSSQFSQFQSCASWGGAGAGAGWASLSSVFKLYGPSRAPELGLGLSLLPGRCAMVRARCARSISRQGIPGGCG